MSDSYQVERRLRPSACVKTASLIARLIRVPLVLAVGWSVLVASTARAATLYWNQNGTTWNDVNDWSTSPTAPGPSPLAVPGAADIAEFNISTVTSLQTLTLDGNQAALGLVFGQASPLISGVTINTGTSGTLTIGASGIVDTSGTNTINNDVVVGAAQTWANNATSLLTLGGAVTNNAGLLTINGTGTGGIAINGNISGTGGLTFNSPTQTLSLAGTNSQSGATTVSGSSVLRINSASALSSNSTVTVASGSQLILASPGTYSASATGFSVTGVPGGSNNPASSNGGGALLFNGGGSYTISSPIAFGTANTEITSKSSASTITLAGALTGGSSARTYFFGGGGASAAALQTFIIGNHNNTYAGSTEVIGGQSNVVLQLAAPTGPGTGGQLPAATSLILAGDNSSGTSLKSWFDLNGSNQTLASIAVAPGGVNAGTTNPALGDNRIGNSNATTSILTLTASANKAVTYSFPIGGGPGDNIGLAIGNTSGTALYQFTAKGASTYTGGTTVNLKGTLQATSGAQQSGSYTLTNGGSTTTGTAAALATMAIGQSVSGAGIQGGTTIIGLDTTTNTITFSKPATSGGAKTLTFATWDAVGNNSPMTVNGTWDLFGTNHAVGGLSGSGTINDSVAGAITLTVGAGNSSGTYTGTLTNGSGTVSVSKTGTGGVVLNGTNSYTGATSIVGGMLGFTSLPASSNVNMNGGDLGLAGGNFTAALGTGNGQVQFTGTGGFAAVGADRSVNIGSGIPLVWGTTANFLPAASTLLLGNSAATNMVTLQNTLDLGGSVRTIQVDRGSGPVDARISGVVSNGGINKTGNGILQLTGTNTFTGGLTVSAGSVQVTPSGTLGGAGNNLVLSGTGTLDLNGLNFSLPILTGNNGGVVTNSSATPATLTITGGGTNFAGSINNGVGTVALNLTTGNTTLRGPSNFSGGTTVPSGAQLTVAGVVTGNSQMGVGPVNLTGGVLSLQGATGYAPGITFNGYAPAGLNGNASPDPDYLTLTKVNAHFATQTPAATALSNANGKLDFNFTNYGPGTGPAFGFVGPESADYGFSFNTQLEVTFTGFINVTQTGVATFSTASDDCSVLFLDNVDTPVVNNNFFQGLTTRTGTYNFTTTGLHPITIVFNQGGGPYGLNVQWAGNGHGMQMLRNSEVTLGGPGGIQAYANAVNVTATSTIDVAGPALDATMGPLTINGSTLNVISSDATSNPYILTLGAATMTGNATFNVAASGGGGPGTLRVGPVADGGQNLKITKNGPGTLVLNGAGTYGGGTLVNQGTVSAATPGALGTGPVTLHDSTTLAVASGSLTGFGGTSIDGSGTGTPWVVNNTNIASNAISSNVLTLTDGANGEGRSAFYKTPVPVVSGSNGFRASFIYQMSGGGGNPADGACFILQNDSRGTAALGNAGGGLGYGDVGAIHPSVALELNVYNGHPLGSNFVSNGALFNYNPTDPVSLTSGDPIKVTLSYDPSTTTITETLLDMASSATFTTTYAGQDIVALLGGSTSAYVGFSGGTGGLNCIQTISDFTYTTLATQAGASYSNTVVLTAGGTETIDVGATSDVPVISIASLTVPSGAASTLNVLTTTANGGNYSLAFGSVNLGANLVLNVANNGSGMGRLTLGATSDTGGSFGITDAGPGVITLSGANTYHGNTLITGANGTLRLVDASGTSSNNIPNSPLISLASQTTLDVTGLKNGTFAVANGQTLTGSGSVNGKLDVRAGGALGSTSGATLTINGGVTLEDQSHSAFTLGAPNGSGNPFSSLINITDPAGLTVIGTNIVDVSGSAQIGTYELYAFSAGSPTVSQFSLGSNAAGAFTYAFSVLANEVDLIVSAGGASGVWNANSSSTYGNATNWDPQSVPSSAGVTATFGNGTLTTVNAPSLTVTVDGAETVGTLLFNNTNGTDYTLGSDGNGSHGITLNNNGSGAAVTVNASGGTGVRTTTIATNLTLSENTTVNVATNNTLQVTGKLTVAAGKTMSKSGAGTEVVTSAPALGNNSKLQVSAGTLKVAATTGTVSVGTGVTAAITGTGTLELAGSLSALGTATVAQRTDITNNSSATAGLLVSAGNQQVGGIDGTGNVQVSTNGNLTANHIVAGALAIGGTQAVHPTLTLSASSSTGTPLGEAGGLALTDSLGASAPLAGGLTPVSAIGATGDGAASLSLPPGSAGLTGGPVSVPEPSTFVLLIAGGLFAAVARCRRRRVAR